MRKNGFTIIEVVVVFMLILGVTFFILPKNLETTKQARFISIWTQKYSELEYMFSAIKAQQNGDLKNKFSKAKDNNDRKNILLKTIKPYLRITSEVKSNYKQYYMNGQKVASVSRYYFDNFYSTSSNEIVGLKWINDNCENKEICAVAAFDLNGITAPNQWGYDIFGIYILENEIEPIGKGVESSILKRNCNNKSYGTYCSYYYLVGGGFD